MRLQQCGVERSNHFPRPAGNGLIFGLFACKRNTNNTYTCEALFNELLSCIFFCSYSWQLLSLLASEVVVRQDDCANPKAVVKQDECAKSSSLLLSKGMRSLVSSSSRFQSRYSGPAFPPNEHMVLT